jgi:hypothetical protein
LGSRLIDESAAQRWKPVTVAARQHVPLGIAVDDAAVYWTTDQGNDTVMKIAKWVFVRQILCDS